MPRATLGRWGKDLAVRFPAEVTAATGFDVGQPSDFARNTGFVIVCPITSKIRPFPTSVVLPEGSAISGEILLGNIRSLDMHARVVRFAGHRISDPVARAVREKLEALITI